MEQKLLIKITNLFETKRKVDIKKNEKVVNGSQNRKASIFKKMVRLVRDLQSASTRPPFASIENLEQQTKLFNLKENL